MLSPTIYAKPFVTHVKLLGSTYSEWNASIGSWLVLSLVLQYTVELWSTQSGVPAWVTKVMAEIIIGTSE